MNDLIELWTKTLGEPPSSSQFAIWGALHTPEIIKRGVLKTATKNQILGGNMSQDHRIRFASKVMMTLTTQAAEHAANRRRLNAEMSGASC